MRERERKEEDSNVLHLSHSPQCIRKWNIFFFYLKTCDYTLLFSLSPLRPLSRSFLRLILLLFIMKYYFFIRFLCHTIVFVWLTHTIKHNQMCENKKKWVNFRKNSLLCSLSLPIAFFTFVLRIFVSLRLFHAVGLMILTLKILFSLLYVMCSAAAMRLKVFI